MILQNGNNIGKSVFMFFEVCTKKWWGSSWKKGKFYIKKEPYFMK